MLLLCHACHHHRPPPAGGDGVLGGARPSLSSIPPPSCMHTGAGGGKAFPLITPPSSFHTGAGGGKPFPLITITSYEMMRRLTCDNCRAGQQPVQQQQQRSQSGPPPPPLPHFGRGPMGGSKGMFSTYNGAWGGQQGHVFHLQWCVGGAGLQGGVPGAAGGAANMSLQGGGGRDWVGAASMSPCLQGGVAGAGGGGGNMSPCLPTPHPAPITRPNTQSHPALPCLALTCPHAFRFS